MRQLLDGLYRASGGLAAISIVAVAAIVLVQVILNLLDLLTDLTIGRPIGLVVPSYAEFAGFFLASATFLALASTWRAGGHVRVALVLHRLPTRVRHWFELWCVGSATVTAGFFTLHAVALVRESLTHGDVSPGLVPVPLWLPQASMAFGLFVLTTALVDHLVDRLRTPAIQGEGVDQPPAAGRQRDRIEAT